MGTPDGPPLTHIEKLRVGFAVASKTCHKEQFCFPGAYPQEIHIINKTQQAAILGHLPLRDDPVGCVGFVKRLMSAIETQWNVKLPATVLELPPLPTPPTTAAAAAAEPETLVTDENQQQQQIEEQVAGEAIREKQENHVNTEERQRDIEKAKQQQQAAGSDEVNNNNNGGGGDDVC